MESYCMHSARIHSFVVSSVPLYKRTRIKNSLDAKRSELLHLRLSQETKQGAIKSSKLCCAKWDTGSLGPPLDEIEKALEAEISPEEQEWLGKWREKCKERKGVVEILECLESEAIMGEDEGKDPNDYNRRAQIFDKSSKVFQALKEKEMTSDQL